MSEGVELILGDCMEVMPDYPHGTFDLVFADPPFEIEAVNLLRYIDEMERVSSGPVLLMQSVQGAINLCKFRAPLTIYPWNKWGGYGKRGGGSLVSAWTPVLIYKQLPIREYLLAEWSEPALTTEHPGERPVELVKALLEAQRAKRVLDPFCGSGTTLVAAKELGISATGIEINGEYAEMARKRIA